MAKQLTQREFQLLLIRDAHLRQGNFQKADIEEIRHLLISKKDLIQCGKEAVKRGDPENAIEAFKQAKAFDEIIALGISYATGEAGPDNYERHLVARSCFETCSATEQQLRLGQKYLNFIDSITGTACNHIFIDMAYRLLSGAKALPELIRLGSLSLSFGYTTTAINCFALAKAANELNNLGCSLIGKQQIDANDEPMKNALFCFKAAGNREKTLECAAWFIRLGKSPATSHRIEIGLTVYKELKETVPEPLVNEVMDALIATGATSAVDYVSEKFAVVRFLEQNREPATKPRRPRPKSAPKGKRKGQI